MNRIFVALLCNLTVLAPAAFAQQQSYPAKPVRIVVGNSASGPTDAVARLVAERLSKAFGQQFIVDNRPGASGMIASQLVARADPDGYTLLMVPATYAVSPSVYKDMKFDAERDFTPIHLIAEGAFVLVVPSSLPVKSVRELIAYAKQQPQPLNYAAAGIGGLPHLAGEMFKTATGINISAVPYKGAAPATIDLLAGQVSFMFNNMVSSLPNIRDGRLRPLAVTTRTRDVSLPDVPTMAEAGVEGYDVSGWYGLLGPAGMDKAVVAKLNAEINRAVQEPAFIEAVRKSGLEVSSSTPEGFAQRLHDEITKWAGVVKAAGITAN